MDLEWLPLPGNFRKELKEAAALGDAERPEALARLAEHRLSYLETIQLDKALGSVAGARGFVPLRLALLSSSTTNHLLPAIRVAGLRKRLLVEIYHGGFGQYRQDLIDPGSLLRSWRPNVVLLSISARDVIGDVPVEASDELAKRRVAAAIAGLRALWKSARGDLGATVIQQSFLDVSEPLFGSHDRLVPGAPFALLNRLNQAVADAAAEDGVALLDIARASARHGLDAWFDQGRWLQGKLEIAPQAAGMYGELAARVLAAQFGRAKKCLVLDLDNTLWGGVIGDDGLEGIQIGNGTALGEAFLAVQQYAKALKERGVILAVCSKNEPETARKPFAAHPEMLLKLDDFAAFRANWTDKAENLRLLAQQLNIGLDSMVFVDDNPAERARVREALPGVAVPELPADPAGYARRVADAGYFDTVGITAEDRERAKQYSENAERESLRERSHSLAEYLQSLDMAVTFGAVTPVTLPRATQLINKTNQFNTTTRRYTSEELASLNRPPDGVVLQFRLTDRFGDNGLVSVIVLRRPSPTADAMEIVNWVMSCRVFGRQLEDEIMNIVVEHGKHLGIKQLVGEFIPTEKNGVIRSLFQTLGFSAPDRREGSPAERWVLELDHYAPRPTFIVRQVHNEQ